MAWDLDFKGGDTPETLDAGGRLVPGWYRAKFDKQEDDKDSGGAKMHFLVSAGPFTGQKATRMLWNPRFADTPERAKTAMAHAKSWAYRLGLITKDDISSNKTVSIDWTKALGKEFIIEVDFQKKDGKPTNFLEVTYMGVYTPDHPGIPAPNAVRPSLGLAVLKDDPGAKGKGRNDGAGAAPMTPPKNTEEVAKSLWN